jgi:hypothetical protein
MSCQQASIFAGRAPDLNPQGTRCLSLSLSEYSCRANDDGGYRPAVKRYNIGNNCAAPRESRTRLR